MRSAILTSVAIGALILLGPPASQAQDSQVQIERIVKNYLATHPEAVGEMVESYLAAHPEVIEAAMAEAIKRLPPATANTNNNAADTGPAVAPSAVIAKNAALLFSSQHQVTLGNPRGDITLVEFFDYSCGYCKRALPDMLTLLDGDPRLKIVLKEFPILGRGSVEAARVAVAVRMQDPGGQKYLAFHEKMFGEPGPASKDKALAAARAVGLDMARLEQDMTSDEVSATLAESTKLADALGIHGTPGYVVGDDVIPGAIGIAGLQEQIATARSHKAN